MAGTIITVAQQKGGSGKTTLAANLAVGFWKAGQRVAMVDIDPQGSLGRWFMTRADRPELIKGMDFTTASAWGIEYETRKLVDAFDMVIIDTPPKADSDLRPALRVADLVVVPISMSHVDVWATEGLLHLAAREEKQVAVVLNRARSGTRLAKEIVNATRALPVQHIKTSIGNRVVYAEAMGQGIGASEAGRGPAHQEVAGLCNEVAHLLASS
jgi:chromosome partitioning protein